MSASCFIVGEGGKMDAFALLHFCKNLRVTCAPDKRL